MGNMCGDNYDKTEDFIISETARFRYLVGLEEDEKCKDPPPEYECLVENYKEDGGINTILEDAIIFYANAVERRSAGVVRLEGICYQPKNDLQNCYNEHHNYSLKCMDEVEAFVKCVNNQLPEIIAGKIRLKQYEKKREKLERELAAKYKI